MSPQNPAAHDLPKPKPDKQNGKTPSLMIPIFKLPVFLYRFRIDAA